MSVMLNEDTYHSMKYLISNMKLKRFLLRYYPPGIIIEYQRSNGEIETKSIDLLNLTQQTDIESLASQILFEEPMITEARRPQLIQLITSLFINRTSCQN